MHTLRAGDLEADWLPEHGMVCASLRHDGEELLGQRGGLEAYLSKGSAFGIPLLAPWANRLDGLTYGQVELDPKLVKGGGDRLPKDGAMGGRTWEVADAGPARLVATHTAGPEVLRVFPFPHRYAVEATLDASTLTVTTTLSALGVVPVPVSFGWHPLFQLPGVPREELELELPPGAQEAVLDTRGIPTGGLQAPSWAGGRLGDAVLDVELHGVGAPLVLRGGGRGLAIRFGGPDYPVARLWAPAGEPFVAWEPMTAPTNALVSGDGLRQVLPGQGLAATFSISLL